MFRTAIPKRGLSLLDYSLEGHNAAAQTFPATSHSTFVGKGSFAAPSLAAAAGHSVGLYDSGAAINQSTQQQPQFVMFKLNRLAIVHAMTFGKTHKVHVSSMKEFKIFGGLNKDDMVELIHSGLRSDDEPETFQLKHMITNGIRFPCRYLKLVLLSNQGAWISSVNPTQWNIQFFGEDNPAVVSKAIEDYTAFRENEAIRLCLKHFRQRNYLDTFESLQKRTRCVLEDPLLTDLYNQLVIHGNFAGCEQIMAQACERGLFQSYISDCKYTPIWRRIMPKGPAPGARGGHQMCIDVEEGKVFLFGGWNGTKDLADFWVFDIAKDDWICISEDTSTVGGPGPRSCHKMCIDQKNHRIYTTGRYVDPDARDSSQLSSDFYVYEIKENKWIKISDDTAKDGGPELIYDHQMCVHPDKQLIYVFGGRTILPTSAVSNVSNVYSGLYVYDIQQRRWTVLRTDNMHIPNTIQLKSRIGHSMLFNPKDQQLYIFAGQRHKEYLSDFYCYDTENDTLFEITRDSSRQGGPGAGFTQRATIDTDLDEIYVLSGLMREKNTTHEAVKNSFWLYNIKKDKWQKIYQNENTDQAYWDRMQNIEPCPRFAHQLAYDQENKIHYLFGGNPGESSPPEQRLDDFWSLKLIRPTPVQVQMRAFFFLRRQRFLEMCANGDSISALRYLQTEVAQTVDHSNEKESAEFRILSAHLFQHHAQRRQQLQQQQQQMAAMEEDTITPTPAGAAAVDPAIYRQRLQLYEDLLMFFPEEMTQPKASLLDHCHISVM